ncbi:MAG TPA: hypothetical protein VGD66_00455 [Allosphingosinicella sp.]|jgi:hypothetical protein
MSRSIAIALIASLAFPAAAFAADPPARQRDDRYITKKICKTEVRPGSRLAGASKCQTQAEWDAERAETRRVVDRIQALKPSSGG